MDENKELVNFKNVINTVKDYLKYILNYKVYLILSLLIGFAAGFAYVKLSPVKYEAKLSFIVNDAKSISQNPIAALAGQLGVSGSNINVSDDRILFLITTKKILGQSLLAVIDEEKITVADKLIALNNYKKGWDKKDTSLQNFSHFTSKSIDNLSYVENKIMDFLISKILKSNDLQSDAVKKKTSSFVGQSSSGIILISYKSKDELLSKKLVDAIYFNLSDFYTQIITKSLKANLDLVSQRLDSTKRIMERSEVAAANEMDISNKIIRFSGKVNEARLRKETELLNVLYAELLKNKEIAKFNYDQEKPVFQIIDKPSFPLEELSKSIIIYSIIGAFLFSFICLIYITILFLKSKIVF